MGGRGKVKGDLAAQVLLERHRSGFTKGQSVKRESQLATLLRSKALVSAADRKVSDRALNRLKAQVEGLLEPEAVRRIRKRLRLTQKDAGRLIGGGPNAFQKYESGDVLVSHAVVSALLLLDRDPSGLAVLTQRADKKVTGGSV